MNREDIDSNDMSDELRTAAILVWHYQRMRGSEAWAAAMETNAEQRRRVERFRAELHSIVGKREDISLKVNGGCVEAEIEGLRFVSLEIPPFRNQGHLTLVTLLGRCPMCGAETMSEPLHNLAGLGRMLEMFEPIQAHLCLTRTGIMPRH